MSVPKSKGGHNHKAKQPPGSVQYPLIENRRVSRKPSGYDSNAQDNDTCVVETAKLRKEKWDAYYAEDEDRGGNEDERATDNYALDGDDDARIIAEEDDPERGTSHPEGDEGNVACQKRIWKQAPPAERMRLAKMVWENPSSRYGKVAKEITPRSLETMSGYQLMVFRAGVRVGIRKHKTRLDKVTCENPPGIRAELTSLLDISTILDEWIAANRPELDDWELTKLLSEKRHVAMNELIDADIEYAVSDVDEVEQDAGEDEDDDEGDDDDDYDDGEVDDVDDDDDDDDEEADGDDEADDEADDDEEPPPKKEKEAVAEGTRATNITKAFYSEQYKGRMVVVVAWVRFLILLRMHNAKKPPQAYKSLGNLQMVMSQLVYWLEPNGKTGTPRASGSNQFHHQGVWWVRCSTSGLAKQTGLSRSSVNNVLDRLKDLGLLEMVMKPQTRKQFVRLRVESFSKEVAVWAATQKQNGSKPLSKEKGPKKSK